MALMALTPLHPEQSTLTSICIPLISITEKGAEDVASLISLLQEWGTKQIVR